MRAASYARILVAALALVVFLGGCATYTAALYGTGPASSD